MLELYFLHLSGRLSVFHTRRTLLALVAFIIDVAVWTALGTLTLTVNDGRPHRAQLPHRALPCQTDHAYGKTPRHGGPVIIIAYRALTLRSARCVGAHMHTPRAPGRAGGGLNHMLLLYLYSYRMHARRVFKVRASVAHMCLLVRAPHLV